MARAGRLFVAGPRLNFSPSDNNFIHGGRIDRNFLPRSKDCTPPRANPIMGEG